MDDTELQQRLTRLAESSAPPPREGLAAAVVARHRSQRRQTLGTAAVAAAVAGLVVLTSTVLDSGPSAETATAVGADAAGPEPAAAAADVLAGPTRGSLAGDPAFVEAVRQLPWTEADDPNRPTALTEPALDSRRVVFAGDVAGGRWALLVAEDTMGSEPTGSASGLAAAWFSGPVGAAADQLQPASLIGGVDLSTPVALTDAATGALVVVAAPGDEVELSRRPEVAADGTVSRSFEPVDAPDGVAVLALDPAAGTYDEALRYRVLRDGVELVTAMPTALRSDWTWSTPDVPIEWLRGAPGSAGARSVLSGGVDHVLQITGVPADAIDFAVVWAGDVPPVAGPAGRLQLLAATLPSGAVYLEALLSQEMGDGLTTGSTWCGADLRPAGTPLSEQVFLLDCSGSSGGGAELGRHLVLIGPATAASAWLVDGSGARATEVPLTDGAAVVPAPDGPTADDVAAASFLAPDGSSLGRAEPLGYDGLESISATAGWD
ncbi:hypothetical protein [Modestobacter italicus]|uniref:hypothetical protein n=1 Tax=Modestobacter italicus (strain DSM 44449 / CECT 9708 / BC 501) TaxID=2732864 RepID=UPI001C97FB45|nr:hypothetical protein [Modestobacter italicus]